MIKLSENICGRFKGRRVAVIGDLVADQFLYGTISRVSREAPVFILKHAETETRPGAAANAAANVASLGGIPLLVGVVGGDQQGKELLAALDLNGVDTKRVVTLPERSTTTKVRVLAGQPYAARQQVIRIDYEDGSVDAGASGIKVLANALEAVAEADAVVISDYNYGLATRELIDAVQQLASERSIPVIADSRFGLREFARFTSATPNQEEAEALLGREFRPEDAESLRSDLDLTSLVVTLGGNGMVLAEKGKPTISVPAVGSEQPVDVTGAGDTVIAAYSLGLASGMTAFEAASLANHAGGIVVMKRGTAVATADEVVRSLASKPPNSTSAAANEA